MLINDKILDICYLRLNRKSFFVSITYFSLVRTLTSLEISREVRKRSCGQESTNAYHTKAGLMILLYDSSSSCQWFLKATVDLQKVAIWSENLQKLFFYYNFDRSAETSYLNSYIATTIFSNICYIKIWMWKNDTLKKSRKFFSVIYCNQR